MVTPNTPEIGFEQNRDRTSERTNILQQEHKLLEDLQAQVRNNPGFEEFITSMQPESLPIDESITPADKVIASNRDQVQQSGLYEVGALA